MKSKAILKSAERYILNKRIPAHMKCMKNFINEKDESSKCVYAKDFVEWKSRRAIENINFTVKIGLQAFKLIVQEKSLQIIQAQE